MRMRELLAGLPLKEKIRRVYRNHKDKLRTNLKRVYNEHKKFVNSFINYSFSGFILAVAIYFIMSLRFHHSLGRFIATIISTSIILAFFEHYYVWVRRDWEVE